MKKRTNKKLLAIPIISGIILAGVWFGPHIHKFDLSIEDGEMSSTIELSSEPHEEPQAAAAPEKDWQQLVTWGIGALNGLFGALFIGKKIFTK